MVEVYKSIRHQSTLIVDWSGLTYTMAIIAQYIFIHIFLESNVCLSISLLYCYLLFLENINTIEAYPGD